LFLKECKEHFPFYITHILTDNGLEFTDKFTGKTKEVSGNHMFDKECGKDDIALQHQKPTVWLKGLMELSKIVPLKLQHIKI